MANKHNQRKDIQEKLSIALMGHDARIKEERKAIKEAKANIKRHKLLKKQARTMAKLQLLDIKS